MIGEIGAPDAIANFDPVSLRLPGTARPRSLLAPIGKKSEISQLSAQASPKVNDHSRFSLNLRIIARKRVLLIRSLFLQERLGRIAVRAGNVKIMVVFSALPLRSYAIKHFALCE